MSQNRHKILIVDSDPTTMMFLDVNLSKFGYEVFSARSSEEALQVANAQRPVLIIAELESEQIDGIEFCWLVRETSQIRTVPVILLVNYDDPELQINGYRSGADAFITKPISMRLLMARAETLIWRYEQLSGSQAAPRTEQPAKRSGLPDDRALQGHLRAFSILELLQFLNSSKKSGMLFLQRGSNSGQIGVANGEVVYGVLDDLRGEEAIYRMASWQEGDFAFSAGTLPEERNVTKATMKLILDCCSVLDKEQFLFPDQSAGNL